MGTYFSQFIRDLSERVSLIASDRLWLEDAAVQQLKTTAQLPGMQRVVGLPDLHPGRGYPVGAAFFSIDRFYPALVGNDIGCGMSLWQTNLLAGKVKLDKLDQQIGNLDKGIDDDEWALLENIEPNLSTCLQQLRARMNPAGLDCTALRSLGTIGGGNHFIELQVTDRIDDEALFTQANMQAKQVQILVHTGSRGLGQMILRSHVDSFGHAGLAWSDLDGSDVNDANDVSDVNNVNNPAAANKYLQQHDAALQFAQFNRTLVALRVLQRLRCRGQMVLDVHHNLVTKAHIGDQTGWLHRKGASPSDQGMVMLPGSRGDYSYLIQPNTNSDNLATNPELALHSLAHGAGRKWQRTDCKAKLFKLASPTQLSRTALGSRVICDDRALIYEEAPQAYKTVDSVVDCLTGAGLAHVVARNKPILTYKTRGECCE
jgi:release factor H-coupled RctB family protein